jgi:hypothetical protein
MTPLWFDPDDLEDEKEDDLYEKEDLDIELDELDPDADTIICPHCGAVIEEYEQCSICGLSVEG